MNPDPRDEGVHDGPDLTEASSTAGPESKRADSSSVKHAWSSTSSSLAIDGDADFAWEDMIPSQPLPIGPINIDISAENKYQCSLQDTE
jgi:hypothetical protein